MSCIISLIPIAIAINATLLSGTINPVVQNHKGKETEKLPVLQTAFADQTLLHKTLTQHGLYVQVSEGNELFVRTEAGTLRYFRGTEGAPFSLEISDVSNMQQLLTSIDELENEYGRNVQKFTYNKVMQGLSEHGMTVASEEILEDASILLTLNL